MTTKNAILANAILCLVLQACEHKLMRNKSEIKNFLHHAAYSEPSHYLFLANYFRKNGKPPIEIIYENKDYVYWGEVDRDGRVNLNAFNKTPRHRMESEIPFYKSKDLFENIRDSLNQYFSDPSQFSMIEDARIIQRGDSVNYQFQVAYNAVHFERGKEEFHALVLTDRYLHILEIFSIDK